MAEKISYTLKVTVAGGPTLSKAQDIEIEAYDKVEVVIPKEANDMEVEIQPASQDQVQFLMISFDPLKDAKISFSIDDPENDPTKRIKLGYVQMLVGPEAVSALGQGKKLNKLYFYREKDQIEKDLSLQILVGRSVK